MNQFLPLVFCLLVSGTVAAAVISVIVCGALDGWSRLEGLRARRAAIPIPPMKK